MSFQTPARALRSPTTAQTGSGFYGSKNSIKNIYIEQNIRSSFRAIFRFAHLEEGYLGFVGNIQAIRRYNHFLVIGNYYFNGTLPRKHIKFIEKRLYRRKISNSVSVRVLFFNLYVIGVQGFFVQGRCEEAAIDKHKKNIKLATKS